MSFHPPRDGQDCSNPDDPDYADPFCGGDRTFIHELIHQLGVGFHAYGPGEYDDGDCGAEFRDCPFARASISITTNLTGLVSVPAILTLACFIAGYGNIMSIMGPSYGPGEELDAHLRYFLYWLDLDEVVVIRNDGQYTINPIADPSASKRAAQVLLTSGAPPDGHSHPGMVTNRALLAFNGKMCIYSIYREKALQTTEQENSASSSRQANGDNFGWSTVGLLDLIPLLRRLNTSLIQKAWSSLLARRSSMQPRVRPRATTGSTSHSTMCGGTRTRAWSSRLTAGMTIRSPSRCLVCAKLPRVTTATATAMASQILSKAPTTLTMTAFQIL
jgi:hypothetical protein